MQTCSNCRPDSSTEMSRRSRLRVASWPKRPACRVVSGGGSRRSSPRPASPTSASICSWRRPSSPARRAPPRTSSWRSSGCRGATSPGGSRPVRTRKRSSGCCFLRAIATCRLARGMKIGVAKEIKSDEYRVALTPAGALELKNRGHDVAIEQGAGVGSSFSDSDYQRVGARIVSVDEGWEGWELVLKVKEPIESEYRLLREGVILFTYLHIAADEPLTRALIDSGIAAVAYETVEV